MLFDMMKYYYDPVVSWDENGIWSVNIYEYSHGKSRICAIVSGSVNSNAQRKSPRLMTNLSAQSI